jgi:hypothetical protein
MNAAGKFLLGMLALGGLGGVAIAIAKAAPRIDGAPTREILPSGAIVFGNLTDAELPSDFNGDGNDVYITRDCTAIAVGRRFLVDNAACNRTWASQDGEASLQRALDEGQPLCAFLHHVVSVEKITDPNAVLAATITGLEPSCRNTPSSTWPTAMQNFTEYLRMNINLFLGLNATN